FCLVWRGYKIQLLFLIEVFRREVHVVPPHDWFPCYTSVSTKPTEDLLLLITPTQKIKAARRTAFCHRYLLRLVSIVITRNIQFDVESCWSAGYAEGATFFRPQHRNNVFSQCE